MTTSEIWEMLAGLGLFIYGMFHLEDALKQMEGRAFKLFLKKHTATKPGAIISGTVVTGVLQSSSIVNLLVLSFVGAGMISMRNALGVMLGANIGGTFNSWLLALLGFKMDLASITLPFIGIAGIAMVIFRDRDSVYRVSKFCMGFGLLFMGLEYMKNSMTNLITHFDFRPYLDYPLIVFVMIGFIITALIQTSSATVVIVLSALYSTIIPLPTAVAVVLGAELGTTLKIMLGSVGGIPAKKRVAWGNMIFNILTSTFGFIFLLPLVKFIQYLGIKDPVLVLVAFQTLINTVGVMAIYFFINNLADFLEKRFRDSTQTATLYIQNDNVEAVNAVETIEKEVELFIRRVILLNMEVFGLEKKTTDIKDAFPAGAGDYFKRYNLVKQSEGEIFSYYARMGKQKREETELIRLSRLMASVRNAMYSLKGMKDINHDRRELSNSGNDVKFAMYEFLRTQVADFYDKVNETFGQTSQEKAFSGLTALLGEIKSDFDKRMEHLYEHAGQKNLKGLDISTLFNINRELFSSCQAMVLSLKDYLLDPAGVEKFDNLPAVVNR